MPCHSAPAASRGAGIEPLGRSASIDTGGLAGAFVAQQRTGDALEIVRAEVLHLDSTAVAVARDAHPGLEALAERVEPKTLTALALAAIGIDLEEAERRATTEGNA